MIDGMSMMSYSRHFKAVLSRTNITLGWKSFRTHKCLVEHMSAHQKGRFLSQSYHKLNKLGTVVTDNNREIQRKT